MDVGDGHVDLGYFHAHQVLDGGVHGVAGVVRYFLERVRVFDNQGHVNGYLGLAYLNVDPLGEVLLANLLPQVTDGACRTAAQGMDSWNLLDGDTGNLGNYSIGDGGCAGRFGKTQR